jgi:MFS family permease
MVSLSLTQPRIKNHMATKPWFITSANRGIRSENTNAALVDSNQFEATGRKPEALREAPPVLATLLPIIVVVFIAYLVIGLALPVLPLHVHQGLGLGTFLVGLVAGAQFAASLLSRLWAGHHADSRGAKRAVVIGLLVAAVAGLLYLLSLRFVHEPQTSVTILLLGRALLGGAESFIVTGAFSWGLALVGPQNTGTIMAWVGTAMYAAFAVGAPAGTALYAGHGFAAIALATTLIPFEPCCSSRRAAPSRRRPPPALHSPECSVPFGCRASAWRSAASASARSPRSSCCSLHNMAGARHGSLLPF